MIRAALLLSAWLAFTADAVAETVVAGLSRDAISITTNFEGSEIVTVEGPPRPVTVRRKARRFGIWVNTDAIEVDAAPTFYAVATTADLETVMTATEDLRQRVSIPNAIRAVGTGVGDQENFIQALMRIRSSEALYQMNENTVTFRDQTLFDTSIRLPANLVEGDYRTRIFLTRDGEVVDALTQDIAVRKVGLERWIYNLAHQQPLAYGILSLAIAIAAGWLASAVFRYLRG